MKRHARRLFIRNSTVLTGLRPKTSQPTRKTTKSKSIFTRINRRSKRRLTKFGIIGANFVLVASVSAFVVSAQSTSSPTSYQSSGAPLAVSEVTKPLDSVSSADVAVHVARLTGLQESTAVVNKADSVNAQLAVASTGDMVSVKPQIIGAGLKSKKDIKNYIVVEGDTVTSLATKFGISADTIRMSNGLSGDSIPVGKQLTISPVNGLIYTVKAGDTPESIATRYFANKEILIAFNDAELTGGFTVGERIVIPDGVQPTVAPISRSTSSGYSAGFSFGSAPSYGSNGYDYGWCTWHAANRRNEIGRPIPNNLGNAITWLSVSRRAGLPTGGEPQAGAVLYHKNIGGLGHVAFVEKLNDDGSALVSDMNYPSWGRVTYRTITPAEFGNYAFIY